MSYRHVQHPASDEIMPLSKGDRSLSQLTGLLGPPSMATDLNVEDRLAHEQWSVEKMFEKQQLYLGNAVSTMVMRSHNPFVTADILPLTYHNSHKFVWSKWHGHRTLAAQTPQGTAPERPSQSREEFSANMNRFELGFTTSVEALESDEGEFALALSLAQVATAFADLFEQLGLTALLTRKHYHRQRLRQMHDPYANAADVFQYEKLMWDIVRKDPKGLGFYTLCGIVKNAQREVISSAVIIPEGIKQLLASGPGNTDYYIHGPGARRNIELGADAVGNNAAQLSLFPVREIELDRQGVRVRPLHRKRTIGDHFRLEDYDVNCLPSSYRKCSRNIKVFDMSVLSGAFKEVDFLVALRATERFNADGGLSAVHKELAKHPLAAARRLGIPFDGNFVDMFIYKKDDVGGGFAVADYIGQCPEQGMPSEALRGVAETVVERILEKTSPTTRNALLAGSRLLNKIFNKKFTENDEVVLRRMIGALSTSSAAGSVLSGNEFGTHDLDVLEDHDLPETGGWLPPGLGSVAGLFTIAATDPNSKVGKALGAETLAIATAYTDAVDAVHAVAASLFLDTHPIFSGAHVPEHFTSTYGPKSRAGREMHSKIMFAQTLLETSRAPLMYTPPAAAPSVPSTAAAPELLEPLRGAIADDVDEAEQLFIEAARARLATGASAAVRRAFATTASIRAFREAYSKTPFASAFKRLSQQKAVDAAEKEASNTTSFGLLAKTHLNDQLPVSASSFANLMHGVVDAVEKETAIQARHIESKFAQWASTAPEPEVALSSSSSRSSSSAAVTGGAVRTRFVAAPQAFSRLQNSAFSHAPARAHDDASIDAVFAHSGAMPKSVSPQQRAAPSFNAFVNKYADEVDSYLDASVSEEQGRSMFNENMRRRWAANAEERDLLLRIAYNLVLLAPINYYTFERWHNANVRVPLSILGERPLRVYWTASMIFVAPGDELGIIAWNNFNFMMSADAFTKQIDGNVSIWACAVVKDETRTYLAEDVIVTNYERGESTEAYSAETFNPMDLNSTSASVFYLLVPAGSLRGPNAVAKTHDVRGFYRADIIENRLTDTARRLVVDQAHYPSALFYNQIYNWSGLSLLSVEAADYFKPDGRSDNTVTHQAHQWVWSNKDEDYSRAILSTDHFGQNVWEGAGNLRTLGTAEHYKDCGYTTTIAPLD